jgi:hypothetical protein
MASAPLLDIPEEETQLLCFCEPKDGDPASEWQRQRLFLKLAKQLCPRVLVFAVPNAGRRSQWEANKAKGEGLRAGVCDLILVWPGSVFFAEFKAGKSMPKPAQVEFLNAMAMRCHHCGVYRKPETLIEHLRAAGAPFVGRLS